MVSPGSGIGISHHRIHDSNSQCLSGGMTTAVISLTRRNRKAARWLVGMMAYTVLAECQSTGPSGIMDPVWRPASAAGTSMASEGR